MHDGAAVKRVVLVPDGMADEPCEELAGRTPLEAAATPAMDELARRGTAGLVTTIPDGMAPGSDVANLAVIGYDPAAVFSGRSPLEAASIGVDLGPGDVAYRCNFVALEDGVMKDNTAGDIANEDGRRCIAALQAALGGGPFEFHAGLSYRNLMVWRGGEVVPCTPPHDILDQPVARYLPGAAGTASAETTAASAETTTAQSGGEAAGRRDGGAAVLRDLMARAHDVLAGVRPSTDIWFWGEGTAPSMPSFKDLYGLRGAVIAAVDLVRGIGRYVGLDVLDVPGATGGLDTDYGAKARAAIAALDDHDLVWVHVEAPDEAGHKGRADLKVEAIERVDREVLAPVVACPAVPAVLVLPDHFTPVSIRTHAGGAVPFAFAPVARDARPAASYSERAAGATGLTLADGRSLLRLFLETTA